MSLPLPLQFGDAKFVTIEMKVPARASSEERRNSGVAAFGKIQSLTIAKNPISPVRMATNRRSALIEPATAVRGTWGLIQAELTTPGRIVEAIPPAWSTIRHASHILRRR
jgi:hypothetical protein